MGRRAECEEAAARSESVPSTEETLALLELQQNVVRAVRELREPYRAAVLLRYTHGVAMREIARRTGVSEAAVRQRLKRGLDMLRADVGVRCGDDWRSLPALGAWLIPGVVEMKKMTSIAAAVLVVASVGAVAVWIERPDAPVAEGERPPVLLVAAEERMGDVRGPTCRPLHGPHEDVCPQARREPSP